MPRRTSDIDEELNDIDFDIEQYSVDKFDDNDPEDALDDFEKDNQEGVLYYNNKKYAAGLVWLADNELDEMELPRKRAARLSADFYCSRNFVQQTGFGFLKLGHKWGMPSIAAMAADALVGEWHGVFRTGNRWLYVAAHADNIAPDGDLLFLTENEAYEHFMSESAKFRWPKAYVPNEWKVKNSDGEIHIEQIIDGMEPAVLKPANANAAFSGKSNKNIIILCLVLLFSIFILYSLASPIVKSFIPERITDPINNFQFNRLVVLPPAEAVKTADPIENLLATTQIPAPIKVLQSCMETFDSLMISIPGWDISKMRCRNNIVESIWNNNVGSLEILRNYIDEFPFRVNKTYGSNGNFLASTTISNFNSLGRPLSLAERQNAILLMNKRFGGLGRLQIQDIPPPSTNQIQGGQSQDEPLKLTVNDLPSLNAVLVTTTSPLPIKENFNIPGLKFNGIEWNLEQNEWIYNMQIFLYPTNINSTQTQ